MSEMQFQDQTDEFGRPPVASGGFDLSGMLIKWGIASSRQQAEYVLIGVTVVIIAIAVFVYFSGSGASDVPTTPNWGTATN
ncbi:hypothetical protein HY971_01970 [Candidatus Kaiserbacteria bacterium]|nr:hypothetical protein [Candidatus Kaiserbacteria bacterium]